MNPWQDHPLVDGTSLEWADAWGEDRFGPWAELHLGEAVQRWRWMPPGTFWMGSPEDEWGRWSNEGPRHLVRITHGYWIADTPCTNAFWFAVTGKRPSRFEGERRPVESVAWSQVRDFLQELNQRVPALDARLPTEAEWEYACRAGTQAATYQEDLHDTTRDATLDRIAWHGGNSGRTTHSVGEKTPNGWGLYDTLGNVWEWCADARRTYEDVIVVNPVGPDPAAGASPAVRGGAWGGGARGVRAACRDGDHPSRAWFDVGFRLARGQGGTSPGAEPPVR